MAFQGFSNDQAPEAFGAMVRRQGAGGNAMTRPSGVTPPGPNHSAEWFGGGPQELSKGGAPSGGPHGIFGMQGMGGVLGPAQGPMDPKYPLGVGEGGPNPGPFTPMGQMGPKGGPMGPGGYYGRPQMGMQPDPAPRGGEGGNPWLEQGPQNPYTPMGQMDPKHPMGLGTPVGDPRFPMHQRLPQMTRAQWQQNRLGQQMPAANPAQPSDEWLGRNDNGAQGWNWSR